MKLNDFIDLEVLEYKALKNVLVRIKKLSKTKPFPKKSIEDIIEKFPDYFRYLSEHKRKKYFNRTPLNLFYEILKFTINNINTFNKNDLVILINIKNKIDSNKNDSK